MIPAQLGNYRIIRQLGSGGMGTVYLGLHTHLKTYAAIKVMQHMTPQDEQDFLREAQTLAQLRHPHILRVLDFGTEGNTPFLVMDYAPGGTLREQHPDGSQLPLHLIISYVTQVAEALQYAHDQRIIHRDVKPANMLVDQPGTVLLSDFGLAVAAHQTRSLKLEDAAGTFLYTAPEQAKGHPRPASDQYALAVVVYEWLCGTTPFHGTRAEEIAIQHITMPPPPLRAHVPGISPAVEHVILKALAKDPHQRFESIQAFATALEKAY
jgi:serine/threonine protein kinase